MDIGKQIKYYRTQKKTTQEELAEYLGVSFQAVSKWENEASTPDISLLPKIAMYFGITIDELFRMPNEAQFERIENLICLEADLDDNTFRYYEKFLTGLTLSDQEKERAFTDLALIYNHRAASAHAKASQYAKTAFELNPKSHSAWSLYLEAENGACSDDWYDNHFEVIQFFKEFLKSHPGNFLALYGIIENLLSDGEYEEALIYISILEKYCPKNRSYMPLMYRGNVALGKGNLNEALSYWEKAIHADPSAWQAFCCMGDNMKKLGRYEEALSYYETCFSMQEPPRISDGLYSIAQIEERLGHYEQAIKAHERIIQNLQDSYGVTKGVEINRQKKEISRLKKLC